MRAIDVVVVGGGPSGAATAALLARRGVDVLLLDRARFPRAKPCGEFLSPAATPLLETLGVRDAIERAGARRLDRVRIVAHGEPVELAFPDLGGGPRWGFSLSRERLDAILLDAARAAGAEVLEQVLVERPRLDAGRVRGVAARRRGERQEIEARIVVGAAGRNDPIARGLGLQCRAERRRFDLLAHWSGGAAGRDPSSREPAPVCELRISGDRYVAAAPVEGDRVNVNGVVPQEALRRAPDAEALYDALLGGDPALDSWTARRTREPVSASDVTPLRTRAATADGAVLVGDAALFLDPFTGQGLYLALRSGELAASAIAGALERGRTDRAALAPYEAARAAEMDAKRNVSRALQQILFRPRLARRAASALRSDGDLASVLAAVTGDLAPAERAWSIPYGVRLARRMIA